MRNSKPLLVDSKGRPLMSTAAYYSDFFQAGSGYQQRTQPWRYYNANNDTANLVTNWSLAILRSASRYLFGNVDIIRGALREEARYSFPLHVRYTGSDTAWGHKVGEPWLYEWHKHNNLRGAPYDSHLSSEVRMKGYKVDGDFFTVLTADPDTAQPLVQHLRAHRIGDRETTGKLTRGPYMGQRIHNGIVKDDYGRTVAVQVLGDTPAEDDWLPSTAVIQSMHPDYSDQDRGIPHLCASILPFIRIHNLHESELRAHQVQSRWAVVQKNETGEADLASLAVAQGVTNADGNCSTIATEQLEDGLIQYVKASTGAAIELIKPDRPGESSQQFWSTIIRGALYAIDWDPDFALALKDPGGAWARTILQKINKSILFNAAIEARAQRREDWYALNVVIANKTIPGPKDGNTWAWEYQLGQPLITADTGNDEQAKREAYKLGTLTLRKLLAPQGDWWMEHRDDREEEADDLMTRAERLQLKHPLWTLTQCADYLEQHKPNGETQSPASASDSAANPIDAKNGKANA